MDRQLPDIYWLGLFQQPRDSIGQLRADGVGLGETAAQVGITAVAGRQRKCTGRYRVSVAYRVRLVHHPGRGRTGSDLVAQRPIEIQDFAAAGVGQPLAQNTRVVRAKIPALGGAISTAPALGGTSLRQARGLRRRVPAESGFRVAGPLYQGGDRAAAVNGIDRDDFQPVVGNIGVALVADAIAVHTRRAGHRCRLQGGDRILGSERQLVCQQGKPVVVDAEGGIRTMVIVGG